VWVKRNEEGTFSVYVDGKEEKLCCIAMKFSRWKRKTALKEKFILGSLSEKLFPSDKFILITNAERFSFGKFIFIDNKFPSIYLT
jgi:hypothetical protein